MKPAGTTAGLFRKAFLFFFLALIPIQSRAETVHTCAPNANVTIGAYVVGANYWNPGTCGGRQCLDIDDKTGKFTVTTSTFNCAPNVASYPFIYYGSHFGSVSPGTVLPLGLADVKAARSSWSFTPADQGSWNAAYDVWFSKGTSTAGGFGGGAELMIWLNYRGNTPPAGKKIGTVTVDGMGWTLWEGPIGWNYIAYLADKPVNSVKDLDLMGFINDCLSRGYLDRSWYLAAVEAGIELRTGGAPFTSNSFSVSIKKGPGTKPSPTPLPGK